MAKIPNLIERILKGALNPKDASTAPSTTPPASPSSSLRAYDVPMHSVQYYHDGPMRSIAMTFNGAASSVAASSVAASSGPLQHIVTPSRSIKERMREEILNDLKSEGLLRTKSDLKEMTKERMTRKIDSVLKKAEKDD